MTFNSTLKPGKPLQRKTPLRAAKPMGRSAWKRSAPKKRAGHNKSYLNACRGQRCYLAVPWVCLGEAGRETVVPCHSNQQAHGKGMGIKADDKFTVPGCAACHAWLDQSGAPKEIKFEAWNLAYARWAARRDKVAA